jgi:SagB-type dehydrogenase family enzyme
MMRVSLPQPILDGKVSVERAICERRSRRNFSSSPLTQQQLSQLLWSAQGIREWGLRTSPSAGATYPIDLYVVVGEVEGLKPGLYRYTPQNHSLALHLDGDLRRDLTLASLSQSFILDAPISIVITADYRRTTRRYGERGKRYVHIEVGHIGENLYLQAEALELGTVAIGAFIDNDVKRILALPENLDPLYIMPFGYPE